MMTPEFITFHGSPGTPYDFEPLKRAIVQAKWYGHIRYTETPVSPVENKTTLSVVMGYSYGCVAALEYAAKNNIQAVILISPYIHPENVSALKKAIVVAPVIGKRILSKSKDKAINDFMKKSCAPAQVPDYYDKYCQHLKNEKLLAASVWEKKNQDVSLKVNLEILKKKECPISIIFGRGDQTSTIETQVEPLLSNYSDDLHIIDDAGHALIYTHVRECAQTIGKIVKALIKFYGLSEKVVQAQKEQLKRFDYTNSNHEFGYQQGEHELNNVASFLYHHLQKNKELDILSWVHPKRLEAWREDSNMPLAHDSIDVESLDFIVGKIAQGLLDLGLKKGDNVVIFIPMSLYLYAAMFAVQKIGAAAVFLDSWARRDQMGVAVDVVSPKAIISVELAFDYLSDVESIQNIPFKIVAAEHEKKYSATLEQLMATDGYASAAKVDKEHTALITFTTGSSGTPKGADRTHRFLAAQHYAINRHLPYIDGDADLPAFPIFSLNNLAAGVKTVIPAFDVGSPKEDDAKILIEQFKQTKTNCTTLSPSLLRALYNYCLKENLKLKDMKRIVTGGAPVNDEDMAKMKEVAPNAEILVLYGSTEVEPMAHISAEQMLSNANELAQDPRFIAEGVNVGKFDSGLKVKYISIQDSSIEIKDEQQWKEYEVIHGEVGEIVVTGEHVCEKYYNNPQATKETKIKDYDNRIWHRTGDLGRVDNNGDLWLVGRVHNAINRDGIYQFPVRAEFLMKRHNDINQAAYLGIKDSTLGQKTLAVFSVTDIDSCDEKKIIEELKEDFQYNKILVDKIVMTDEIPMDPRHHSKVEYAILRKKLEEKGLLNDK